MLQLIFVHSNSTWTFKSERRYSPTNESIASHAIYLNEMEEDSVPYILNATVYFLHANTVPPCKTTSTSCGDLTAHWNQSYKTSNPLQFLLNQHSIRVIFTIQTSEWGTAQLFTQSTQVKVWTSGQKSGFDVIVIQRHYFCSTHRGCRVKGSRSTLSSGHWTAGCVAHTHIIVVEEKPDLLRLYCQLLTVDCGTVCRTVALKQGRQGGREEERERREEGGFMMDKYEDRRGEREWEGGGNNNTEHPESLRKRQMTFMESDLVLCIWMCGIQSALDTVWALKTKAVWLIMINQ